MNLELMAMVWLRVQKRCVIVTRERTLRWSAGKPDVLGITASRHLVEIEIKRTVSDFRADFRKGHRANREFYIEQQPKYFYYLAPKNVADKIKDEIPDWAGLMTNGEHAEAEVIKAAPTNKRSRRVSLRECVTAVTHQTNFILSLEKQIDYHRNSFIWGCDPWLGWEENGTYQI